MAAPSKKPQSDIETILGGRAVVYGRRGRAGELHTAVREGLSLRSFDHVAEALDLRTAELGALIGVAPRTLARRKNDKALSAAESDRLVGIARIASLAEETLGSRERARGWLRQPTVALRGVAPLALLDTEPGRRQVEEELLRISYGIYS
jgi:putative toxin-antitoxin system antitoxin component (TIGR02293 family)